MGAGRDTILPMGADELVPHGPPMRLIDRLVSFDGSAGVVEAEVTEASLFAGEKAHAEGYTQVLWLDGVEQRYVEEVGSMNIFFVIDGELITPALNGSILPGITRDSVMTLARSWGLKVAERRIAIDEVLEAHRGGTLQEIFGSGTAAVISPVGQLRYGETTLAIGDGKAGPLSERLFKAITDIQYGIAEDPTCLLPNGSLRSKMTGDCKMRTSKASLCNDAPMPANALKTA